MNEYETQAQAFLDKTSTTISMVRYPDGLKPQNSAFEDNSRRNVYKVTLTRKNEMGHDVKSYSFDFFDSINNREKMKRPTNYSILACIDTYVDSDMTLDDFASEFGYDSAEHKISDTIKTYNACLEMTRSLKEMFTEEELAELNEIN